MDLDLLDLYGQASEWTGAKVRGASTELDAPSNCDGWDVRTLMNHMLETQRYFAGSARGEDVQLSPDPPDLLSGDPGSDFAEARADTLRTFGAPGAIEKTGPALGIAFSDQLLHGWDLAVSTGQDATMPQGLPDAAYEMIHGRFTDEQRKGVFKPEINIGSGASAQARLLAYTGRDPSQGA
ncbi:MAG TPA: TIGR03086 family metal-binding protein [Acidimicrobiales bacterium]|nr:TIGR03086 family metal-binding protein [Acidimicrobiales bacterium]